MKRGQFELSLNWIYVIIVGIFVIFLFTKLGVFVFKKSDFNNANEIAEYFNNIIVELYSTYNQQGTVDLENVEFNIIEEDGFSKIKYKNKISGLKSIIFSPESLKGKISYWSYGYKRGVLSSKILLLSDERYKYIFYYKDENDKIKNLLLKELPENYNEYFKIIFTNNINSYAGLKNKKVVCLNLEEDFCNIIVLEEEDNFILKYKDENSNVGEYYVYTPNEVFFAVFSNSKKYFEDTMKLLEEKNVIVLDIFIEKTKLLKQEEQNNNNNNLCLDSYDSIIDDFEKLKGFTLKQNSVLKNSDYNNIIKDLEEKNILLFRNNCKTVY